MNRRKNFKKYRPYVFTWNLDNITFNTCGLDVEKNFLQAPLCECGCGNYLDICAYDDEIADICGNFAEINDCEHCGVFAITSKNDCVFALKMFDEENEEIVITIYRKDGITDYRNIGYIADELELHCYGLLVCKKPGLYRIVME